MFVQISKLDRKAQKLTLCSIGAGGDCCHLFSKWWLTSRSQTGRQNILKNHDNRGFLLLVMNFQNYLSVTKGIGTYISHRNCLFMRIPSKCYTTVFFTKVETVIIQLNLTCHFEEKIDLKKTTEITIALLSPQNNWKCFADIRLLDQIGRHG